MSAPVWVLSVNLETKTATFTSGLAEAARSARTSLGDIKNSAKDMSGGFEQSSRNLRADIGLIDNTIRGAHAMAMADLVREFSQTKIVMAALPFAATLAGFVAVAGIIVEAGMKIKEMREEHEKLAMAETRFGTTVQESFNSLDEKLLNAAKRSDELRNDHLAALDKELQLINKESMADLVKQFGLVSKAADEVFKGLESHWYTWGIGSSGATHALEQFKTQYESLLSKGKDKEASDLLGGTLASAERVLKLQHQMADAQNSNVHFSSAKERELKWNQASEELRKSGVGITEKEVRAQQILVDSLRDQFTAQQKIATIAGKEGDNAKKQVSNEGSARESEAARQLAASQLAINEQKLAAERATANASLEISRSSVAAKLASDLAFAQREMQVKLAGNAAEAAALDKAGKDYANQLQNLRNKALEIEQQHATQVAQLTATASVEQAKRDIANLEAGERAKIQATQEGSTARLAAIESAARTAETYGLQETDFYRTLGTERVEVERQIADQTAKIKADLGKEAAEHTQRMGQLEIAAVLETQSWLNSARRVSEAEAVAQQLAASEMEFQLKQQSLQQQMAALDTGNKEYEVKLRALQNRETELIQEHEDQKTAIVDRAQMDRTQRTMAAQLLAERSTAQSLTAMITGHQTFSQVLQQYSRQAAGALIQMAVASVDANERSKMSDAGAAAREAFKSTMKAFPAPFNLIAAPIAGAAAFSSMMAFADGGIVPGVGRGDVVPAMLTPGEGVVPKGVMEGLSNVAKSGGFSGGGDTYHLHVRPTYNVQTIDGNGMEDALEKHSGVLQRHFENTLRKMNRR